MVRMGDGIVVTLSPNWNGDIAIMRAETHETLTHALITQY